MTSRMLKTTVFAAVIATAFAGGYSINHEQSLVAAHAAAQAPAASTAAPAPAPLAMPRAGFSAWGLMGLSKGSGCLMAARRWRQFGRTLPVNSRR